MERKETQICNWFAEAYTDALTRPNKAPISFITDMAKKYAEAYAKGAIFFGPFALFPKDEYVWELHDMRAGWGFSPLDITIYNTAEEAKPGVPPSIRKIKNIIMGNINALKEQIIQLETAYTDVDNKKSGN